MKTTTIRITEEQMSWVRENRPQQLSRIVREHLDELIHSESPVNFHNAWRESAQKCYPHMRGGYCAICWPSGTPSKLEWTEYIRENGIGARKTWTYEEWSMSRHARRQTVLDDWNEKHLIDSSKPGWIRRFFFKES